MHPNKTGVFASKPLRNDMKRFLLIALVLASLQMFAPQTFAAHGQYYYGHQRHYHHSHWSPGFSFGYSSWSPSWYWGSSWGYPYRPYYYPGATIVYEQPYYYSSRPNYTLGGALLGGLLGGVIGHNSGRHGWEGAAIGAGTGLVLGSVADSQAYGRDRRGYRYESRSDYQPESPPPAAANQRAQTIPDAPRVPEAPVVPAAQTINALFGR